MYRRPGIARTMLLAVSPDCFSPSSRVFAASGIRLKNTDAIRPAVACDRQHDRTVQHVCMCYALPMLWGLLHNIDDLRGIGILPVGKIDSLLPSETVKSAQEGDR